MPKHKRNKKHKKGKHYKQTEKSVNFTLDREAHDIIKNANNKKVTSKTFGTTKVENDVLHIEKRANCIAALQQASLRTNINYNIDMSKTVIPEYKANIIKAMITDVTNNPQYVFNAITFHKVIHSATYDSSIPCNLPKPHKHLPKRRESLVSEGGYTLKEIAFLHKQPATMEVAKFHRAIPPAGPSELVILLDVEFNPVLVLCGAPFATSPIITESQKAVLDEISRNNKIWYGGCGLSGFGKYGRTADLMENCKEAREAICGEGGEPHFIAAGEGCASVTLKYRNKKKNNTTSYRVGGIIYRSKDTWQQLSTRMGGTCDVFVEAVIDLMAVFDPFLSPASDEDAKKRNGTRLKDLLPGQDIKEVFTVAGNKTVISERIGNGGHGYHSDSTTEGVAAVLADTLTPGRLYSHDIYGGSKGCLLFEIGMVIVPYNEGDIVIFDGCYFHAPLYPSPSKCSRKSPATRASVVVFRNQSRSRYKN